MSTRLALASIFLLVSCGVLAGCGDDDGGSMPAQDAGTDAAPVEHDAGGPDDAGPAPVDATTADAGAADAGDPFGPGGPPWAALEVLTSGTCDALEPCGGAELGTWEITGGCLEVPVSPDLMRCTGAAVTGATGRARGRVTFDGTTARRVAQSEVTVQVYVPRVCALLAGGCPGIETMIRGMVPDTTCAADAVGNCECTLRAASAIDETDGYTIQSGQIVSSTSGKRWDYCVEGGAMQYEDASPSGPREPGIFELTRR